MTAIDVLERADELTDGTGGSVGAVMGAAIGPYRKSRFSVFTLRALAGVLCFLLLAACAKEQPTRDASPVQASFAFLEDGKTTKEDLRSRLGPPSGEFNQGKIWTYSRLETAYHLVVVFGDQDVVKTHRILKVR